MKSSQLALATLATAFACNAAMAAPISRTEVTMAVAACQSALPVFDGVIRKRPLAVQNEGTSSAFMTCGLEGVFSAQPHSTFIGIGLLNTGTQAVTVNCTLVDGGNGFSVPEYFPVSRVVQPGSTSEISWSPEDPAGFIYPAISCNLAPGTGIEYLARQFMEEIGN